MAAATTSWTEQGRPPLGPKGNRHSERCKAFYFSLANRLEDLERSLQSKWLSLEWVALAVEFVRSTYSDVNRLLEGLKDISADANESVDDWVEEYMVESMKLLDVCNLLKPAVSLFEQYQMCVQLVLQASNRCTGAGCGDSAANMTLRAALQSCEEELGRMVNSAPLPSKRLKAHPEDKRFERLLTTTSLDMKSMLRRVAIAEKLNDDRLGSISSAKTSGSVRPAGLTEVMRATRETTDFVASVLLWALNSSSSHLLSTANHANLNIWGDNDLWSPSFRRLQQKLNEKIAEIGREQDEQHKNYIFSFQEPKLVEACASELKQEIARLVEVRSSCTSEFEVQELPIRSIQDTVQQLRERLSKLRGGVERVSSQLTSLFDELVRSRKKLMDAAQNPPSIHRAYTW
ncbi:unnamed protein product [Sphagnum compactum]